MIRRRSNRTHFSLGPTQRKAIDATAASLPPNQRHAFLLAVAMTLQISTQPPGFVTDAQVQGAIQSALAEVAV